MYDRLPLDFIGITEKFGNRIDPITGVTAYHYGVDFGWNKYQGEPIYAPHDAQVVLESFDNNLGNYIVLMHEKADQRIITRYLHMKSRSTLKSGDNIKRKEIIGYMGSSGYSTGTHLHFEYWICPKNYIYNYVDRSKYAVDPLKYCYLFDDQNASSSSIEDLIKVVGEPKEKNEDNNQIKVIGRYLNCFKSPSINAPILGYIDYGYYDIVDKKQQDNYTWYQIDENKWIKDDNESIEIYLNDNNSEETTTLPCETIIEENIDLKKQIKNQEKIIEDLINNNSFNEYNSYQAKEDDYYYIALKKGETIYFPK